MYCPTHFEEQRSDVLLDLIAQHPLATIVTQRDGGLVADHIPMLYQDNGSAPGTLIGHVAKSNPLWQAAPAQEHLLIFHGAGSYISPNWYATKAASGKVVPTWNYAVVIEFHITRLTGKWKVSQNQPQENQQSVVKGLRASGSLGTDQMAELVTQFGADLKK